MNRKFIVKVCTRPFAKLSEIDEVSVWAPNRHNAKAQIARELVERGWAYDFIEACNRHIVGCRVVRETEGPRGPKGTSKSIAPKIRNLGL